MDPFLALLLGAAIFAVGLIAGAGLSDHEARITRMERERDVILRKLDLDVRP